MAPKRCEHCPPTHRGGDGVCGGLSLCGSPQHTHSRQLLTTPSHSRARIRTPHASQHRCIPWHAVMATTGQCQTRAGHAGRPHGRGRVAEGWRQGGGRQLVGSEAVRTPPTNTQGWWCVCVCVCVCGGLSLCGSPHHTHSRQLPTTPSHSRARIRTPHARYHRCIPFHAVLATTGQCQTRAGHAGRPHGRGRVAAARRQVGGRKLVGSEAVRTLPTNTQGWWWVCVCVVVSASVALHTTLTPAFSQPLPHIHAPEYARHTPATTVASHFMPSWPAIRHCQTRAVGMLADHMVAAEWRKGGGRVAADSWLAPKRCEHCPPTHRGGGVCVCVCV